jgi:peptidoglycan LD-endopeptidase LytH
MALAPRARVLLIAALCLAALAALVGFLSYRHLARPAQPIPPPRPEAVEAPAPASTPAPPAPPFAETPTPPPADSPAPNAPAAPTPAAGDGAPAGRLVMPVAGVRPEQLTDTFTQSRSEGREHNAIDIIAPRGTPVRAAVDGRVVKLFNSEKGGITLYQLGPDGRTVYYYAHLDRYAEGMAEGRTVRRGETIAYVGDTGNAQPGNYHLHFQIYVVSDPQKIWDGDPVNPYPLLLNAEP